MTQDNLMIIIAFALYLGLMMYIGVYYYRKSNSIGDYILGGRQLGPWITALSAEASDMSGWMLMGVPGLAYTTGDFWCMDCCRPYIRYMGKLEVCF